MRSRWMVIGILLSAMGCAAEEEPYDIYDVLPLRQCDDGEGHGRYRAMDIESQDVLVVVVEGCGQGPNGAPGAEACWNGEFEELAPENPGEAPKIAAQINIAVDAEFDCDDFQEETWFGGRRFDLTGVRDAWFAKHGGEAGVATLLFDGRQLEYPFVR